MILDHKLLQNGKDLKNRECIIYMIISIQALKLDCNNQYLTSVLIDFIIIVHKNN